MEGKSLCMAFCGEAGGDVPESGPATNLVVLDFGGMKAATPQRPSSRGPSPRDALFAPLSEFINGDGGVEWHDPSKGLVVVRGILTKLREGATVSLEPDFDFSGDDEDGLTEAVSADLEDLEAILTTAQREGARFRLMIEA